jgi:hypothetical protein
MFEPSPKYNRGDIIEIIGGAYEKKHPYNMAEENKHLIGKLGRVVSFKPIHFPMALTGEARGPVQEAR